METILKKNMDETMNEIMNEIMEKTMDEEEKTMHDMDDMKTMVDMDNLPVLKLTPSSYVNNDGTHYWKYWCDECGEKISSCFSQCKCIKVKKDEKVTDILFSIPIDDFNFDFEDQAPSSPPKLEIAISSYTKDGVTEWRYPCGVCHRGLPNATSFCCCSICGNRTPGYWSPCITCKSK
jgi:hypothetical protein